MRTLILINSFVYGILMTSREKYNISFLGDEGVTRHMEQRRAYDMDFTTSLRELFALVATSSHLCIVLPPTNATHYDLKPHVIQLLPSFYGLDHENPYSHVKKFKKYPYHHQIPKFFRRICPT